MTTFGQEEDSKSIIDAAMAIAANRGWRAITMADIAAKAGLPLSRVHSTYRSKAEILTGLSRLADASVLADALIDTGEESARDRLFDVIMRRFDALSPYKPGLAALVRELPEPSVALALAHQLTNSMRWMLEAADIDTSGLRGSIHAAGLAGIYANVMRTWLRDDTLDSARTMSELDRELRWAEQLMNSLGGGSRKRQHQGGPSPAVPPGPVDPSI